MASGGCDPATRMVAAPEVQDRRDLVQVTETLW